jgi:hypothetical protein
MRSGSDVNSPLFLGKCLKLRTRREIRGTAEILGPKNPLKCKNLVFGCPAFTTASI